MIQTDSTPQEVIQQVMDDLVRIKNLAHAVHREVESEIAQFNYVKLKPHPADVEDELDDLQRELYNWLLRNGLDAIPHRGDLMRAPEDTITTRRGLFGRQARKG